MSSECSFSKNGEIQLILGPMYSGKTSLLGTMMRRFKIAGRSCIMVKHRSDIRYSDTQIISHDKISFDEFTVSRTYLSEICETLMKYDVICIDELQFFIDAPIVCDMLADLGKVVIAAGLNGTYKRESFPVINEMIPLCSNIIFRTAVCRETGKDAIYSENIGTEEGDFLVGGLETYRASDRQTYNDKYGTMDLNKKHLKNFTMFFLRDIAKLDNDDCDKYITLVMDKYTDNDASKITPYKDVLYNIFLNEDLANLCLILHDKLDR